MRKKMVAGNWKMCGTRDEAQALLVGIQQAAHALSNVDVVVFPSFVHLQQAESILASSPVAWGAQNLYLGNTGAFTGEVSGAMLAEYGCRYVLIGHSERRSLFNEDVTLIAAKFNAAVSAGLRPVLCVGETQSEREKNATDAVIQAQLDSVIEASGIENFKLAVIAYEPVWAIGTGLTATPEQAQAVHNKIRQQLAKHDAHIADTIQILYGGSVKEDNAKGLFGMPDIDGGLVGGASLKLQSFLAICQAAADGSK